MILATRQVQIEFFAVIYASKERALVELVPYASAARSSERENAMRATKAYARTTRPSAEDVARPSIIDADYVEVAPQRPAQKSSAAAKAADRITAGLVAAFLLGILIASVVGVPSGVAGVFTSAGILLCSMAFVGIVSWLVAGPRR